MFKALVTGLVFLTSTAHALTTETFQENGEVSIHLSDSNANRLTVRDDKITRVHFPEGALSIQNEVDGSLYATLMMEEPFTLFLSTDAGRHFSATVHPKAALGQTIEFVPKQVARPQKKQVISYAVEDLLHEMVLDHKPEGYLKQKRSGKVTRYQSGLQVSPKFNYIGAHLNGEVLTLYHAGRTPITLREAWFSSSETAAVRLSSKTLMPGEYATIYQVVRHA